MIGCTWLVSLHRGRYNLFKQRWFCTTGKVLFSTSPSSSLKDPLNNFSLKSISKRWSYNLVNLSKALKAQRRWTQFPGPRPNETIVKPNSKVLNNALYLCFCTSFLQIFLFLPFRVAVNIYLKLVKRNLSSHCLMYLTKRIYCYRKTVHLHIRESGTRECLWHLKNK